MTRDMQKSVNGHGFANERFRRYEGLLVSVAFVYFFAFLFFRSQKLAFFYRSQQMFCQKYSL